MSWTPRKNTALRNKVANNWAAMWDSGTLSIYDATHVLLLEYPLGAQAFNPAGTVWPNFGKVSLHAGSQTTQLGVGTGNASYAVLRSASPGEYEISGFTVGTESAHVIINNISVEVDQPVTLNKFDWTETELMKLPPY